MKTHLKRIVVVVLLVSLTACAAGCASSALLDEKVTAMIGYTIAHDPEGGYDMLYPGVQEHDAYVAAFDKASDYFPVTDGYKMRRQQLRVTKGINNDYEITEGQYKVKFDGQVFYVYASWRTDPEGEGFTSFLVFNKEDWKAVHTG